MNIKESGRSACFIRFDALTDLLRFKSVVVVVSQEISRSRTERDPALAAHLANGLSAPSSLVTLLPRRPAQISAERRTRKNPLDVG